MQSQTFYAPALTPFLKRWAENGVKFVGSRYATEFDNVTMYSAMVSMPHAGHVVEIVSDKVGSAYAADFAPLDDRACPDAVKVSASARALKAMWERMGGTESDDDDAGKLPSLLIAKVSNPSESPGELYRYLAEFGSDEVAHNYTRVDFGPAESFCEFDRVRLRKCTYADDDACSDDHYNWHIDVQSVNNPSAVQGRYSVGFYEHAVQGYHSAMLGCNRDGTATSTIVRPRARAPLCDTARARASPTPARARARAQTSACGASSPRSSTASRPRCARRASAFTRTRARAPSARSGRRASAASRSSSAASTRTSSSTSRRSGC